MNENDKLLHEAIASMLGSWGLLRGVVDTCWDEYKFKKLNNLKSYLDKSQLNLHKLSNKQLEQLMIDELYKEMTSNLKSVRNKRKPNCGLFGNLDG